MREIVEQRTQTSRTFLNFDGTGTAEVHALPIHFQDGGGAWQPIDTTLASSNKQGFAYANTTNALKSYLPSTADGWVRVEAGDVAVSFQPIGASSNAATVGNDTVSFAASNNVATVYQVLPGRLKETLTLSAPGASSFSYNLQLDGLTARQNEDNSVTLTDASGLPALRLSSPWMRDADGRRTTAIQVSLSDAGNGLVYTLTPDAAWLAKAAYPVVIDPTVTYYNGDTTDYITLGDPNDGGSGNYNGGTISFSNGSSPLVALDTDVSSVTLNVPGADSYTGSGNIPIVVTTSYDTVAAVENGSSYPFFAAFGVSVPNTAEHVANFADHSLSFTLTLGSSPPSGTSVTLRDVDFSLSITSIATGWYTFQGNSRHTGRTQYAISDTPSQQWSLTLPSTSSPLAYTSGAEPDLPPSLLAVPTSDPAYVDVYAIVSNNTGITACRIRDHNTNSTTSLTVSPDLNATLGFKPGGTPLLYNSRLYVPVNEHFVIGTSPTVIYEKGFIYVLDASTLSLINLGTGHPNPIPLGDSTQTTNGLTHAALAYDPANNGILVTFNNSVDGSGNESSGKLRSLDAGDGHTIWTASLYGRATSSAPLAYNGYAYAASSNGGENSEVQSFALSNGTLASTTSGVNDPVQASLPIAKNKIVYGQNVGDYSSISTNIITLGTNGSLSQSSFGGYTYSPIFATSAYYAESDISTVFDSNAQGVGYLLGTSLPIAQWHNSAPLSTSSPYNPLYADRASPLIAGTPGSSARVFLPVDEGSSSATTSRILVMDAATGTLQGSSSSGIAASSLSGKARSSMASFGGRLYLLTTSGKLYCFQ